jgi:hypothetical protein
MHLLFIQDQTAIGMPFRQGPVKAGAVLDRPTQGGFGIGRGHVAELANDADEVAG